MEPAEILVITGFGPFREFLVNPSWTAAQGLQSVGLGENIHVHIKEIPVSYEKTQRIVAELWDKIQPKFMVHLGVSRGLRGITLEQTGRNSGYTERDVCGVCPEGHCCVEGGAERLESLVNMKSVYRQCKRQGMDIVYSRDAGRFLCDFAYYCSLYHGQRRAALIHIPSTGRLLSTLVPLLKDVIQAILQQLEDTQVEEESGCSRGEGRGTL